MGDLHKGEWKKKHSTTTDGWIITVSGPEGYTIGRDRQSTTYLLPVGSCTQSLSHSVLLLDDLESDDESASQAPSDTRSHIKVDNSGATQALADHSKPLAAGAERIVYKAVYTDGSRKGESCVKKVFKTGSVYREEAFAKDLEVVAQAQTFLAKFGDDLHVRKQLRHRLHLNRPSVWTHQSESDPHKSLIEPFIEGQYTHFNSNTGWQDSSTSEGSQIAQAMSHFSYHESGRKMVLCDLQGVQKSMDVIFTDPAVCSSAERTFGPTDLGQKGIQSVMERHQCNKYCNPGWLKVDKSFLPAGRPIPLYNPAQGTTFLALN